MKCTGSLNFSASATRMPPRAVPSSFAIFFLNDTATTEIYTLSLHDALPIWATNYYRFIPTVTLDAKKLALLSEQVDPYGHTNRFVYLETNNVVRLLSVIDADGRTNKIGRAHV